MVEEEEEVTEEVDSLEPTSRVIKSSILKRDRAVASRASLETPIRMIDTLELAEARESQMKRRVALVEETGAANLIEHTSKAKSTKRFQRVKLHRNLSRKRLLLNPKRKSHQRLRKKR